MSRIRLFVPATARIPIALCTALLLVSFYSPCKASAIPSLTLSRKVGPPDPAARHDYSVPRQRRRIDDCAAYRGHKRVSATRGEVIPRLPA